MFTPAQQVLFQQAVVLHQRMKLEAAARIYQVLLAAYPLHPDLLQLLGVLHHQRGDPQTGIALMQKSLAINPDQAPVYMNLGNALQALQRHEEALASYQRAIAFKADYAEAYFNCGVLLNALQRYAQALENYQHAIRLAPNYAAAYLNQGNTLKDLRRYDEALDSYGEALRCDPQYAEAFNNRGTICDELGRFDEALDNYRRAVELNPKYAEALNNMGGVLRKLRRYQEAVESYGQALALAPDMPFLAGIHLHMKQHICDWSGLEKDTRQLLDQVDRGKTCASPFMLLATPATPAQQLRCATTYAGTLYRRVDASGATHKHDKIRIGYFSADFHNHATTYLMAEFFERHDRDRFEVYGFSWGAFAQSDMRMRVEAAFDRLVDIQFQSDREAADLARQLELDIAVDLKGYTQGARPGIFAHRPAPVQVSYMGFPGTLGTPSIDYLIADAIVIPPEHRPHYSERIAYLPDTYWVNDTKLVVPDCQFTRGELGLPDSGFVFGSFNNNYKISPDVFDIWMRLLRNVQGSVLWLLEGSAAVKENLQREAVQRGVAADRLVFGARTFSGEHLARHWHADLFLDTFYCNGHTTTSDALWTGVPVITYPGETFTARVAASLLSAVGLPELIAPSPQAYEALALDLATNPEKLQQIKAKLAANRLTYPLFDTARFTRHFEAAYVQMWQRSQNGQPPGDIVVTALD